MGVLSSLAAICKRSRPRSSSPLSSVLSRGRWGPVYLPGATFLPSARRFLLAVLATSWPGSRARRGTPREQGKQTVRQSPLSSGRPCGYLCGCTQFGLGGLVVRILQKLLAAPNGAGPRELALMLAAVLGMILAILASLI